eukprot:scaffold18269_cov71-Phaeocystis_antarctica.AAC.6
MHFPERPCVAHLLLSALNVHLQYDHVLDRKVRQDPSDHVDLARHEGGLARILQARARLRRHGTAHDELKCVLCRVQGHPSIVGGRGRGHSHKGVPGWGAASARRVKAVSDQCRVAIDCTHLRRRCKGRNLGLKNRRHAGFHLQVHGTRPFADAAVRRVDERAEVVQRAGGWQRRCWQRPAAVQRCDAALEIRRDQRRSLKGVDLPGGWRQRKISGF